MFSSQTPIGLDISTTTLTAVAARRRGKVYVIDKVATGDVPEGAVVDGEVRDVEALSQAIRQLWSDAGLSIKTVNVGIANQRCVTRIIEMPRIKQKKQLEQAIGFEAQDLLPIPIEESVWDYHVIEEFEDPDSGQPKFRVILVMAYRESIEAFVEAVHAAGLKVATADLAAFALMRAGLRPLSKDEQNAIEAAASADQAGEGSTDGDEAAGGPSRPQYPVTVLCNIGPTSTNVVVARRGVCELTRIVSAGTKVFTDALHEQFGWSVAECERVRMEAGVLPFGGAESPDDPYTPSREVMRFAADQLAHEIKTSIDYYQHQSQNKATELVIAGEGTLLRGLEQRFADQLGLPVTVLDATARVDVASLEKSVGASHAHLGMAIGLVLEDAA